MSDKITSKNLAYDASLPPFLAALHAQVGGSSGPDAILAGRRRAAKARSGSEEAEDAPLVVDEHGNQVALEVTADGTVKPGQESSEVGSGNEKSMSKDAAPKDEEKVAGIGGMKKRKAAKVIGDDDGEERKLKPKEENPKEDEDAETKSDPRTGKDGGKPRKKPKKIKLSFNEDGD